MLLPGAWCDAAQPFSQLNQVNKFQMFTRYPGYWACGRAPHLEHDVVLHQAMQRELGLVVHEDLHRLQGNDRAGHASARAPSPTTRSRVGAPLVALQTLHCKSDTESWAGGRLFELNIAVRRQHGRAMHAVRDASQRSSQMI